MRTQTVPRSLLIALLLAGTARADPVVDIVWSSTTGDGTTPSVAIEAVPGDELTADLYLSNPPGPTSVGGIQDYAVSFQWDNDGSNELDLTGFDLVLPPGFDFNAGGVTTQESGSGSGGFAVNFSAATLFFGSPGNPSGDPMLIGTLYFAVTINVATDGDDVESNATGLFNPGDFITDNAEVNVSGISTYEGAAVDRGATFCADTEFDPADWLVTPLFQIGCSSPATAMQVGTGGNPDAHREMTHYPCTGQLRIFHEYTGCEFDPSSLPPGESLEIIEYGEDRRVISAPVPAATINASPALVQGGVVYTMNANFAFSDTAWTPMQTGLLTESDFVQWNGSAQPDFSGTGGVIRFGYIRYGGSTWEEPMVHAIDNWKVLTSHPIALPEPASGLAIVSGCAFLAMLSRRRELRRRRAP